MKHLLKISILDLRLIFRDPSLRGMLFLPVALFGLIVWFLPGVVDNYDILKPYTYIFLIVGVIENTQMFSFISSMVLIDEKETEVAKIYGIVPLSKFHYILSRLFLPYVITVLLNIILLGIQPFFAIDFLPNIIISIFSALVVPVYVLSINCLATTRVEGLVYIKAFNMLVLLPLAAFFVPEKFSYLFGILPTHWIFQSIQKIILGQQYALQLIAGLAIFILILAIVSKQFQKRHFI